MLIGPEFGIRPRLRIKKRGLKPQELLEPFDFAKVEFDFVKVEFAFDKVEFDFDKVECDFVKVEFDFGKVCLLYTSPSPRDKRQSRMPSSA